MKETKGAVVGAVCSVFYLMGAGDTVSDQRQASIVVGSLIVGAIAGHYMASDSDDGI